MQTVIALALILASGWNTNGQDGIVTISDPAGDEMVISASCASFLYYSDYPTLRDGINALSATPEYMKACF